MNFIFDIGNVLISFQPLPFLGSLFSERLLIDKLYKTVFQSPEWTKFDQGTLTHEEACHIFCMREPDVQQEIRQVMQHLKDTLIPMPDTVALLPEIKKAGHDLYYLSDNHKELGRYLVNTHSFFELFDGGVFSCDVHVRKPAAEIYRYLLEKYQLDPRECLFFDDKEENVAAANKEGMHGVLFTDAACVKPFLNRPV